MSQSHRIVASIRTWLALLLAVPAVAAVGALLVGCGGSTSGSSAAAKEQSAEQKAETRLADFARCLREHGINAETASGPGGGHGIKLNGGSPQTMEAAQNACARYRPEPKKLNLSPQQKVEREEQVQKFARCMREHGIKVEAKTSGGAIQIGIHAHAGEAGAPNPESPAFQTAQKDCQGLLPGPPGGAAKGAPALGGPGGGPATRSEGGGKSSSGSSFSLSAGG
jgi:hypothetical protein